MNTSQINLAETPDFDLGGLRVSAARRRVVFKSRERELEPRVAQVLVALAFARPDVVSRDRLIDQCWDGRIVGDDALNRCIVALRHLAKDFSPEPFTIETVPRVGYRLVERSHRKSPPKRKRRVQMAVGIALISAAAFTGMLTFDRQRSSNDQPMPASIAVTSFRNLSNGDPYFAEGIGEEIVGQLAQEPQFRVAGRVSARESGPDADAREVARHLHVEYVVEGSVRRQGEQVRVNADLVRASDGFRVWSNSYDGKLDDIFAIQQRIGGAIAGALRRKLIRTPALSGSLVTNGQVYELYLTARGLIKTRKRDVFATASNLLRDAINLDPKYAPAWSSLAESTSFEDSAGGSEAWVAEMPRAVAYAQHALQLAPDFADGHRVLASLLPYGSPEALSHFRRAVELDPNNAECLIDLGSALGAAGEFDAEMATYQRARETDPFWFRTTGQSAIRLAEMGRRADAEAIGRQGFAKDAPNLHIILGRVAWIFGDYSEAARQWSITARANSPRWSARAQSGVGDARAAVGLDPARDGLKLFSPFSRERAEVRTDAAPSALIWRMHNRNVTAATVYRDENDLAAKLMLNAGRVKELVSTYDSPTGLLSLRSDAPVRADQLHEAALVALALRQAGRRADADLLLVRANSKIAVIYRQRMIPFAVDADVSAIWAVQGRPDQALSMLEMAMRRGWTHSSSTDLPDIGDEPVFNSLRAQPRFQRLRVALAAHLARERTQTIQLRL